MLELPPAPAWTRIVPASLLKRFLMLLCGYPSHDVRGRSIRRQLSGHESHVRVDMTEEHLIAGAQIVQAGFAVGRFGEPMFGALAIAGEPDVAFAAVTREGRFLGFAEGTLLAGVDERLERRLHDVPEPVLRIHEVVARIQITAVLDGEC